LKLIDRFKCWIKYRVLKIERHPQEFWLKERYIDYKTGIEKSWFLVDLIRSLPIDGQGDCSDISTIIKVEKRWSIIIATIMEEQFRSLCEELFNFKQP